MKTTLGTPLRLRIRRLKLDDAESVPWRAALAKPISMLD
jgi:hypothetical protein